MAIPIITGLISLGSLIVNGITEHFKEKQETNRIVVQSKRKVIEAKTDAVIDEAATNNKYNADLDFLLVESRGWKDEYLLLLTTLPVFLIFIPSMRPYIYEGFKALELTPEWYLVALGIVYVDAFGLRRLLRTVIEKWINKKFP